MACSGQTALHDTTTTRRRHFIGQILQLPSTRVASLTLEWIPEYGSSKIGRPKRHGKTVDTLKEDFETMSVWIGVTRELLPVIVPSGDVSSINVPRE